MKWAFLISGIIELIAAVVCYFAADLIFNDSPDYLIKLYGISALTLGAINTILFVHFNEHKATKLIYVAMMFFHGAIAMMTYGNQSSIINHPTAAIATHLGLFGILFIGYMSDIKPEK